MSYLAFYFDQMSYSTICRTDELSYSTNCRVDEMVFDELSWKHFAVPDLCFHIVVHRKSQKLQCGNLEKLEERVSRDMLLRIQNTYHEN